MGQGGQQLTIYSCRVCTWELSRRDVGLYRLGVEHGRQDAWSKPPRSRAPRWAIAVVVSLGLPLVGAGPYDVVPEPPGPAEHESLGACQKSNEIYEKDVETLWGRQLGVRCKDDACRARAMTEAKRNRERVAEALAEASEAHYQLGRVQENARPCSRNRIPGCAEYMVPLLADREGRVLARYLRHKELVEGHRLSRDEPTPPPQ